MSRVEVTQVSTPLSDGMLQTVLPLSSTSQFVKDNVGNTSALSLSTSAIGVGGLINATGFGQKIRAIGQGDASIGIYRNQGSSFPAKLEFIKSRGTYDAPLIVSANDQIGNIGFYGYDGTAYRQSAAINATALSTSATYVEGTMKLSVWNNTGSNFDKIGIYKEGVYVGDTVAVPTAQLQIKGKGSTSATTSLLVQNSSGTNALKITDDGLIAIFNNKLYDGSNQSKCFQINANTNLISNFGAIECRVFDGSGYNVALEVLGNNAESRVKIGGGSIDNSAKLQIDSTTKGFLPPRMTTAEKNAIATPAEGLIVYDTTLRKLCVRGAATWETITSI